MVTIIFGIIAENNVDTDIYFLPYSSIMDLVQEIKSDLIQIDIRTRNIL